MNLNDVHRGITKNKSRKRIGRRPGSGHGKTATRGSKGQGSRSGSSTSPIFEGGQMPLHRRLPKRGFTNPFRVESQVVHLLDLALLPKGAEVNRETLAAAGLIKSSKGHAKLLANGEITHAVTVRGIKMSATAREKIVAAGGRVEE